jgi:hypothetical protein
MVVQGIVNDCSEYLGTENLGSEEEEEEEEEEKMKHEHLQRPCVVCLET